MTFDSMLPQQILPSKAPLVGTGVKVTGIHAGKEGELSFTDDYLYICVIAGDEVSAVWKKVVLFKSI